jgi:hypothetical protein
MILNPYDFSLKKYQKNFIKKINNMIQYRLIKRISKSPRISHNEKHSNFKGFEYYDSFPEFWLK